MKAQRFLQVLMMLLALAAVSLSIAPPASAAGKTGCSGGACFNAQGSGNHVSPQVCMYTTTGTSVSGHMQIRWHHNGVDSTENSAEGYITPGARCHKVNFMVDAKTYICGRWWHWTGSAWILSFGDYKCVKAPL